jgi:hypothetical protein
MENKINLLTPVAYLVFVFKSMEGRFTTTDHFKQLLHIYTLFFNMNIYYKNIQLATY